MYRKNLINFRRAKEKRLKKDAGRARWGQYFRSLKSSTSPCPMGGDKRVDSDRDSELELDYNHCKSISFIKNKYMKKQMTKNY